MTSHDDDYGPSSHPTGRMSAVRPPTPIVRLYDNDDDGDPKEAETKVECPLCRGCGVVTTEERAVWLQEHIRNVEPDGAA